MPEPSLVVTPFSKKQPPPNDSPTEVTLDTALAKAPGTAVPSVPFKFDHRAGLETAWVIVVDARLLDRFTEPGVP